MSHILNISVADFATVINTVAVGVVLALAALGISLDPRLRGLEKHLRLRHRDAWHRYGLDREPSNPLIVFNRSRVTWRFVRQRQYRELNDPEMSRFCDRLRIVSQAFVALLIATVVLGATASWMSWSLYALPGH